MKIPDGLGEALQKKLGGHLSPNGASLPMIEVEELTVERAIADGEVVSAVVAYYRSVGLTAVPDKHLCFGIMEQQDLIAVITNFSESGGRILVSVQKI